MPMHVSPKANSHKSPTCTTQAIVPHSMVPHSVLQTVLYTDLDLLDRSAYPCLLCDILRRVLCWGLPVTYCLFRTCY